MKSQPKEKKLRQRQIHKTRIGGPWSQGKDKRRFDAITRQAVYNLLTPQQKLDKLEDHKATKQRRKLESAL